MPTPKELRVAQLRDRLQGQDFIVHEVVDVEPTSSDEECDAEGGAAPPGGWRGREEEEEEEEGDGEWRGEGGGNRSLNSNEVTVDEINREIRERRQWELVGAGGKGGKGEAAVKVTPEKGGENKAVEWGVD